MSDKFIFDERLGPPGRIFARIRKATPWLLELEFTGDGYSSAMRADVDPDLLTKLGTALIRASEEQKKALTELKERILAERPPRE